MELLNVSENATFLCPTRRGPRCCACTGSDTTRAEIASELAWMDALRAEAGVRTPRSCPPRRRRIVCGRTWLGSGYRRHCVRFEFLPGAEPQSALSGSHFAELGEITPGCTGTPGSGAARPGSAVPLDYPAASAPGPGGALAGRIGVGPSERRVLARLTTCSAPAWRVGTVRRGTGWCTRTPGWPTCSCRMDR